MKKTSFLVAILAILQVVASARLANAQDRIGDRRTAEEAIDLAGDDIGQELEALFEQLGLTADKMGHSLERWADENSEDLEAWSDKYGEKWEAWSARLEKKLERLGANQEQVWNRWAERYERDLNRWAEKVENSDSFDADSAGEFVERNLKMLSEMPLGQLVDQALKQGVGELSDAPWESLGELTEFAQEALQEPLEELSGVLDSESRELDAIRQHSEQIIRSLDQLKRDVERNISDNGQTEDSRSENRLEINRTLDSRIEALERVLENEDLPSGQRERIEQMIKTLRDAEILRGKARSGLRSNAIAPRRDQIIEKIEREKQRHNEALRSFNDDLRRSSEQSRLNDQRVRDRDMDNRRPKRADGKNIDQSPSQPSSAKKDPIQWFRDGREGRADQRQKGQRTPPKKDTGKRSPNESDSKAKKSELSELELMRRELDKLRKEVQRMKEDRS